MEKRFVHIITGGINTGKSTKLMEIQKSLGKGDGFVLVKSFDDSMYIGQKILRLSTGESCMFSIKKEFLKESQEPNNSWKLCKNFKPCETWNETYSYKDYSFSREGIYFAEAVIRDTLDKSIGPIFIDEIGPLELTGKGFAAILKELLAANMDVYMAVRDSCLHEVICQFSINNFDITYI